MNSYSLDAVIGFSVQLIYTGDSFDCCFFSQVNDQTKHTLSHTEGT